MGTFITVIVNQGVLDSQSARALPALCPVDIFVPSGESVAVNPAEEDECTLCELCLDAAPPGAIVIHKLYSGARLVSRRAASDSDE